ncbi:hypothetical protein BGZ94_005596 [Podila epigama]|nr:hypothetical protein BGZ94_005596 [Podila epigama]
MSPAMGDSQGDDCLNRQWPQMRNRCRTVSSSDSDATLDAKDTDSFLSSSTASPPGPLDTQTTSAFTINKKASTETLVAQDEPKTTKSSSKTLKTDSEGFRSLYNPPNSRLWSLASTMVIAGVAALSKTFMTFGAQTRVHNINPFLNILCNPERKHADDPILWGTLPWKCYWNPSRTIRYALGAQELCYPNRPIGAFFQCGQVVPIVRGNGIFQPAIDESIKLLRQSKWVHVFPEGKVIQSSELTRLKWGVGRILLELAGRPVRPTDTGGCNDRQEDSNSTLRYASAENDHDHDHDHDHEREHGEEQFNINDGKTWEEIKDGMPIVVPIYHFGMDDILRLYPDNSSPILPKLGMPLTIVYGEPIDFSKVLTEYKEGLIDEVNARVKVTECIHTAMVRLREVAQALHCELVSGIEAKQSWSQSSSTSTFVRALSWVKPVGWGWWHSPDLVMPKE